MCLSPVYDPAKKPKSLVVGGCGFIGQATVKELLDHGHEVTVVDNHSSSYDEDLIVHDPRAQYVHQAVEGLEWGRDLFHDANVVCLVGKSSVDHCNKYPLSAMRHNVQNVMKTLELCKRYKAKKFLLASSSAVYGEAVNSPEMVSLYFAPNVYAATKVAAEQMVRLYSLDNGFKTVCMRYFNVYGPHTPHTRRSKPVLDILFDKFEKNKKVTLFNNGDNYRDFVHVKDVAKANRLALETDTRQFEVFNIGTGLPVSIGEIARYIKDHTGSNSYIEYVEPREGDPPVSIANIEKTTVRLGWNPEEKLETFLNNVCKKKVPA